MKRNNRWIALLTAMVISVCMLASCAGGRTYEDLAGDRGAVSVDGKDEVQDVPYTGDPIIDIVNIPGQTIYVTEEDDSGSGSSDNNNGGNGGNSENSGNSGNSENTGNGGNSEGGEGEDEDFKWDEESGIPEYTSDDVIAVLSQNVRCVDDTKPSGNSPGYPGTSLANRHLRIKHQVDEISPDVIGFQEVRRDWEALLIADYGKEYDYYYCYRESGTKVANGAGDECSAVFWRKDRFEKMGTGEFWLSDTPSVPSKFSDQTDQIRVCNWVKLKNKKTGKQFLFASVHYSTDPNGRDKSGAVMNSQLKAVAGKLPVIVVGDFNTEPNSAAYNHLVTAGLVADLNKELNFYVDREFDNHSTSGGYKTTNFDKNGEAFGSIIDFIMISYDSTGLYPLHYEVLQKKYGSAYGIADDYCSDHFGVFGKVVIPS